MDLPDGPVAGLACGPSGSAQPAAEMAAWLAEAYRLIAELTAQAGRLAAAWKTLSVRCAGIRPRRHGLRRLGTDRRRGHGAFPGNGLK